MKWLNDIANCSHAGSEIADGFAKTRFKRERDVRKRSLNLA